MAILPTPTTDYTDADFDSLRARMYNLISVAFPDWTEQAVASFGNLLIEMFAHVGDVLGFYLDARARESRITLAAQRQSVVALAKLIGYVPAGASAATGTVTLTLLRSAQYAVVIPRGTVVRTPSATEPILFQTLDDAVIQEGESSIANVPIEHSQSFLEAYPSTELANQEVHLGQSPHLDSSELVTTSSGEWARVPNFLASTASDLHYTVQIDQNERAHLRFGNGTNGSIPVGQIGVSYKIGGGSNGNVEPNSIRKVEGTIVDVYGNQVQLSATNPLPTRGGQPRKSRIDMQVQAPAQLRVLTRTVAREDYEINALRVPGVTRALMLTKNQVPAIAENRGILYIVPAGGGNASNAMLSAVYNMVTVEYPNTVTFRLAVRSAIYLTVNVQATVYLRRGALPRLVDAAIRANLAQLFALRLDVGTEDERDNPAVNFGFYAAETSAGQFDGLLALSDIANAVRDTAGVRKLGDGINDLLVNNAHADLTVQAHQFPQLGKVTLLNGETNAPLV
jgi:hypothetical protein